MHHSCTIRSESHELGNFCQWKKPENRVISNFMFIIVIQKKGTKFGELQLLKNEKSERGDGNNTK